MANVTGTVNSPITFRYTKDLTVNSFTFDFPAGGSMITFGNGTTVGNIDTLYIARLTVASSAAATQLDLAGAITDPTGATASFARVDGIYVKNNSTTSILTMGADAAALVNWVGGATHSVKIRPGWKFLMSNDATDTTGVAVTATTADILAFNINTGTNQTFDIAVWGRSA